MKGLFFGKFVSQDKNKITVERLDENRIIISTYSKREIDIRTLHSKKMYSRPDTTLSLLNISLEEPGTSRTTRMTSYRQFAGMRKPSIL